MFHIVGIILIMFMENPDALEVHSLLVCFQVQWNSIRRCLFGMKMEIIL